MPGSLLYNYHLMSSAPLSSVETRSAQGISPGRGRPLLSPSQDRQDKGTSTGAFSAIWRTRSPPTASPLHLRRGAMRPERHRAWPRKRGRRQGEGGRGRLFRPLVRLDIFDGAPIELINPRLPHLPPGLLCSSTLPRTRTQTRTRTRGTQETEKRRVGPGRACERR